MGGSRGHGTAANPDASLVRREPTEAVSCWTSRSVRASSPRPKTYGSQPRHQLWGEYQGRPEDAGASSRQHDLGSLWPPVHRGSGRGCGPAGRCLHCGGLDPNWTGMDQGQGQAVNPLPGKSLTWACRSGSRGNRPHNLRVKSPRATISSKSAQWSLATLNWRSDTPPFRLGCFRRLHLRYVFDHCVSSRTGEERDTGRLWTRIAAENQGRLRIGSLPKLRSASSRCRAHRRWGTRCIRAGSRTMSPNMIGRYPPGDRGGRRFLCARCFDPEHPIYLRG